MKSLCADDSKHGAGNTLAEVSSMKFCGDFCTMLVTSHSP